MPSEPITLELGADEALVLFEWLKRFNEEDHAFEDRAEERVLWDLEATLETRLVEPLSADYKEKLRSARARVRGEGE